MRGQPNSHSAAPLVRPPWATEASVRQNCIGCGDCIAACPEQILRPGRAKAPIVDFTETGCTFCGACAEACKEPVFDLGQPPWPLVAEISSACLLTLGISCQSCADACDEEALRFDLSVRPAGRVSVAASNCTACGSCVGICPTDAIAMAPAPTPAAEVAHA